MRFNVVSSGGRNGLDEFIVLAYGNSAKFLQQHASSGNRIVAQGRLSSEKLDTDVYHTAVTVNRVLSVSPGEQGIDYNRVVVSGNATCEGTRTVGENNRTLASFNIANSRKYMSRDGEERTYTTYLGATMWGERAEQLEQEGIIPIEDENVTIEGILKPRSYTNKDGEEVNKIDIWIDDLVIAQSHYSPSPRRKRGQETQETQNSDSQTRPQAQQRKSVDSSPF